MPASYTLRLQFGTHEDAPAVAARLVRLCREAMVDEAMLFFFAEEFNNGHDTLDEIRAWIDWSRPVTTALREAGVRTTLNPWHTLLHVDRGRRLKPGQDWQPMMDIRGRACTAVVCPLDEGWRAYYQESLELYAAADFDVIWIDDDIRYHNHGDLEWGGCFCPLHMKAFSAAAGRPVSREELLEASTAAGEPHPWRALWMDLWERQHLLLLDRWRRLVERKGKRLGLMSSLPEQHAAEGRRWNDWWKVFTTDGVVFHRPHFWNYGPVESASFPLALNILDQNRSIQPANVKSGPEIECIPYGGWNKPFRQLAAQLVAAQVHGSDHLQLSIYDHMGNDPDDEPERAVFLARWKPALDWLAELFPPSLRTRGVRVPWSEDMGRCLRAEPGRGWNSLLCRSRGWAGWLGAAGVGTSVVDEAAPVALNGSILASFTNETLEQWLSGAVLLDGPAAMELERRGLAHLTGLGNVRTITQNEVVYATECCIHPEFTQRPGALLSVNSEFFTPYGQVLYQGRPASGAVAVTDLRAPRQEVVGHGILAYRNEQGGRVVITPWSAETTVHMNTLRAFQLQRLAAFLHGSRAAGFASGAPWLVPLVLADGEQWRVVIWNVSDDDVTSCRWEPLAGMAQVDEAWQLNVAGERKPVKVRLPELRLAEPLRAWECVVLAGRQDRPGTS